MRAAYLFVLLLLALPLYATQPQDCTVCTRTFINLQIDYSSSPQTANATLYGVTIDYRKVTGVEQQLQSLYTSTYMFGAGDRGTVEAGFVSRGITITNEQQIVNGWVFTDDSGQQYLVEWQGSQLNVYALVLKDYSNIGANVKPLVNENVKFFLDTGVKPDTEICAGGVKTDSNGVAVCNELTSRTYPSRKFQVYAVYEGRIVPPDTSTSPPTPAETRLPSTSNSVLYTVSGLPVALNILADNNCFIFFVILGVLVAGMYASGRNPFNAFDLNFPKLPRPKKTGFRRTYVPLGSFHTQRDQLRSVLEVGAAMGSLKPEIIQRFMELGTISRAEVDSILKSSSSEIDKALALRALLAIDPNDPNRQAEIRRILLGDLSVREAERRYRERELANEFQGVGWLGAEMQRGKLTTMEIEERMSAYDRLISAQIESARQRGDARALRAYNELFNKLRELHTLAHAREVGIMALEANRRAYGMDGLILGNAQSALDLIALSPQIYVKNWMKPRMVRLVSPMVGEKHGTVVGSLIAETVKKAVDIPVSAFDIVVGMPARLIIGSLGIGKLQARGAASALGQLFGVSGQLVLGRVYPALREMNLNQNYLELRGVLLNNHLFNLTREQRDRLDEIHAIVQANGSNVTGDAVLAMRMVLAGGFTQQNIHDVAVGGMNPTQKMEFVKQLENNIANNRGSVLSDLYIAGYSDNAGHVLMDQNGRPILDPITGRPRMASETTEDSIMERIRMTNTVIEQFAQSGLITSAQADNLRSNLATHDEAQNRTNRWALEKAERLVRRESLEQTVREFLMEFQWSAARAMSFRIDDTELEPTFRTQAGETGLTYYTDRSYDAVRGKLERLGVRPTDEQWAEIVRRVDGKAAESIAQTRFEGTYNTLQAIVGARFGIEGIRESVRSGGRYSEVPRGQQDTRGAMIEEAYNNLLALDLRRQLETLYKNAGIRDELRTRGLVEGQEVTYDMAKKGIWVATSDMEWVPYFAGMKLSIADTPINAAVGKNGEVLPIGESLRQTTLENFVFKFTNWIREPLERAVTAGIMNVGGDLWRAKVTQEVHRERLLYIQEKMVTGEMPTLLGSEATIPSFSLKNTVTLRKIIGDLEKLPIYLREMERIQKKEFSILGCRTVDEAQTRYEQEVERCHSDGRPLSQQYQNLKEQIDTYNVLAQAFRENVRVHNLNLYDQNGVLQNGGVDVQPFCDPIALRITDASRLNNEIGRLRGMLDQQRSQVYREWEILSPLYEVALGFHRMQRSITKTIYKTPRMTYSGYGMGLFGPGVFPFGPMAYDEPPMRDLMGVHPMGKALGAMLTVPYHLGRIGASLTRPFMILTAGVPDLRDMDLAIQKQPNLVEAYASLWQFWKFWNFRYPVFKLWSKSNYYLWEEEAMMRPQIRGTSGFYSENLIGEWGPLKSPAETKEEAIHELPSFLRFTASGVSGYPFFASTWGGRSWNPFGRWFNRRGEFAETITGHGPILGTIDERVIPEQLAGIRGVRAASSRGNRIAPDFAGSTLIDPVNATAFQYYRWGHLVTEAERRSANFDIYRRNLLGEVLIKQLDQEKASMGPFAAGYEPMWATLSPIAALLALGNHAVSKRYAMNRGVGRMLRNYPQTFCRKCGTQTTQGIPCSTCGYNPTIGGPGPRPGTP